MSASLETQMKDQSDEENGYSNVKVHDGWVAYW